MGAMTALRLGIPETPPGSIQRQRLEAVLDAGIARAVTVVTGPPGAGKTVLLAGWAATHGAAWISVRGRHRDAARLWQDIVRALATVGVQATCETDTPGGPLTELHLDATGPRAVLVLDD